MYVVNIIVFLIFIYINKKNEKVRFSLLFYVYFFYLFGLIRIDIIDRCIVGVNGDIKDILLFMKKISFFFR